MHRTSQTLIALAALAATVAPATQAQTDMRQWNEPIVAQTTLRFSSDGSLDGDTLYLPLGRRISFEAEAVDQYGRAFPQERFRFGFDLDRSCNGLVDLEGFSHGTITVRTGKRAGACEVLYWVPNNMNLDQHLRIQVGVKTAPVVRKPTTGAIDTREELVAASLFRAILGREPDPEWLAGAAEQVRRNETRDQIRSLLGGPEFSDRRRRVSPDQLLEGFYQGLLGRPADPAGIRSYRDEMHQGKYEEVILDILSSREFHDRLARELG